MKISEMFSSIQGEGIWIGVPSFFIRVAGCNLECTWCDTIYARNLENAKDFSTDEIIAEALNSGLQHIVITGGEPSLYPDEIKKICSAMHENFRKVTIETNGSNFIECEADLISISPKFSGSQLDHSIECWYPEIIRKYMEHGIQAQIKCVVGTEIEARDAIMKISSENFPKNLVFLMPKANNRDLILAGADWLVKFCCDSGFKYGARLHILLWDTTKSC